MIKNRNLAVGARRREFSVMPRTSAGSDAILTTASTTTFPVWAIGRKVKLTRVSVACRTVPAIATGTAELFIDNIDKSEGGTDVLSSSFDLETLVADQAQSISLLSTVEGGEVFRILEAGDFVMARFVTGTTVSTQVVGLNLSFEYEYVDNEDNDDVAVDLAS